MDGRENFQAAEGLKPLSRIGLADPSRPLTRVDILTLSFKFFLCQVQQFLLVKINSHDYCPET